jgi:hypothetical protein
MLRQAGLPAQTSEEQKCWVKASSRRGLVGVLRLAANARRPDIDGGAHWRGGKHMDAQRYHDEEYWKDFDPEKLKLISREKLEALLREKNGPSGEPRRSARPALVDPIEQAMRDHPGLTREEAEEMAREFGF